MLKRKAAERLRAWKESRARRGLMVMGARQVGKTTTIREFARAHYDVVAEVNFFEDERAVETISGATSAKDLFLRITALSGKEVVAGRTLVFLDEIQECGDVLTWLKFLEESTDCDYVLSGSRLGLDAFDVRSLPVGSLETMEMFPLDFEEFCWADGIAEPVIDEARECFLGRRPIPAFIHDKLMDAFYRYVLVGGMPAATWAYAETNALPETRAAQEAIVDLYEYDISKYVIDKTESRQIRMVYESIPGQLNRANKRFKFTRLSKSARFANLETAFDWLESAGVALETIRVSDPSFPLGLTEDRSSFKLYMNDVGLLTSRLMREVDLDILNRKSSMNFGSIFENAVAQELRSQGFPLFYYQSTSVGEIDFLLQDASGDVSLCEVKSGKDYRRHSAMSNLLGTDNYRFKGAYVLCDGNLAQEGPITYAPIYLAGMLRLG